MDDVAFFKTLSRQENLGKKCVDYAFLWIGFLLGIYPIFLALLTRKKFQAHVVYLHAFQMTWFKNLNVPENFGFLKNQVTPFSISTPDGENLYAWHILPLQLYSKYEKELWNESTGFVADITSRIAFRLLKGDSEAKLIIHMHGAAGTVGSGYRVPNYRALSAGHPEKLHVLTFDYRGFGYSTGKPSESGLIQDAIAVVDWAMNMAGISPSRILIFGQSLGTAVSIAVIEHFSRQSHPIIFAGTVLVAPFINIPILVSTYRIAGIIPILSPLVKFPRLFKYLQYFIQDQWISKDRIVQYIQANELNHRKYHLTLIHGKNDYDIPWQHTERLFWYAIKAALSGRISDEALEERKKTLTINLDAAGFMTEWKTENGLIQERILETGLHDVIMSYPIITLAVVQAFEASSLYSSEEKLSMSPIHR